MKVLIRKKHLGLNSGAPPGVFEINEKGDLSVTPYGVGYLSAELSKKAGERFPGAIVNLTNTVANMLGDLLASGMSALKAHRLTDEALAAGNMRLEEIYHVTPPSIGMLH